MWSILENVPCALKKKVYFSVFGWNALKISMRSISSNVSLKTCVSLLVFCFDDLSTAVSGVLWKNGFNHISSSNNHKGYSLPGLVFGATCN